MDSKYSEAFAKGQLFFRKNNYSKARYWYKLAMQDEQYRDDSILQTIEMDFKEGNFFNARRLLEANKDSNNMQFKSMYGLLETIENNFKQSNKYYDEAMHDPKEQYKSLLAISKIYIQNGDYDIAEAMLDTLSLNPEFYFKSLTSKIAIKMYQHKFLEAHKLLSTIDKSSLSSKLKKQYKITDIYIQYFLGNLKESNYSKYYENLYTTYRLYNKSEEVLLKHIDRHKDQLRRNTQGCFFKDLDTKKLLTDARDIIKGMNGNHLKNSDIYRFRMDKPIGYKKDKVTRDLCVATIIGTKDIITMYPILLSSEFDKEKFSTSKEVKMKRLGGIRK